MSKKVIKILSFLLCLLFIFQQTGFAQVAGELDISGHLLALRNSFIQDTFRPLHLRYISYDALSNNFNLLLDKGDSLKGLSPKVTDPNEALQQETKTLLNYFFIGLVLPNESFWVNLRPDSPNNIIDDELAKTDIGKIFLEADLQLKKDTANFTSPQTPEGKEYWNKLYKKAEELYGNENITIPTLTRPWIVPGEIIIREAKDNAYIYKAALKVMLEQDYLKDSTTYAFKDERSKALNEYSSQLIRELIIPKLTKEVNSSKRYAPLRQVYYSLILAQWFKQKFPQQQGRNLTDLASKEDWSKTTYFNAYKQSFAQGEYSIKEPVYTPTGQVIRSYFSGGIKMLMAPVVLEIAGSPVGNKPYLMPMAYRNGIVTQPLAGSPLRDKSFDSHEIESLKSDLAYQYMIFHDFGGAHSHVINYIEYSIRKGRFLNQNGIKITANKIKHLSGAYTDAFFDAQEYMVNDQDKFLETMNKLLRAHSQMLKEYINLRNLFLKEHIIFEDLDLVISILSEGHEAIEINLPKTLQWVINRVKKSTGREIRLINQIPEEHGRILADKYQLYRVLRNLIKNSEAAFWNVYKKMEYEEIQITLEAKNNEYLIAYRDNGPGIAAEKLSRIFEPGFSSGDKTVDPFSGYGLAICKDIISKFGGTITVESELGKGTTFTITLPAASSPAAAGSEAAPSKRSLRLREKDDKFVDSAIFLHEIGVGKDSNIVNVGMRDYFIIGLAAARLGAHYSGFDKEKDSQHGLDRYNVNEFGGNANHILGEFSSNVNSNSKDIKDHTQDFVLIMTGALSDPWPVSDAKEVLREALRIIKHQGRIVAGSYKTAWEFLERDKAKRIIEEVLNEPEWKDRVALRFIKSVNFWVTEGDIYEVIFSNNEKIAEPMPVSVTSGDNAASPLGMVSQKRSLATLDNDEDFQAAIDLLKKAGIAENSHVIEVGPSINNHIALAALRLGIHYHSFDAHIENGHLIKEKISRYDINEFGGSFKHSDGYFADPEMRVSQSRGIESRSQDAVVILSVLDQHFRFHNPQENKALIKEALRVIKQGGKLIIGYFDGLEKETVAGLWQAINSLSPAGVELKEVSQFSNRMQWKYSGHIYEVNFSSSPASADSAKPVASPVLSEQKIQDLEKELAFYMMAWHDLGNLAQPLISAMLRSMLKKEIGKNSIDLDKLRGLMHRSMKLTMDAEEVRENPERLSGALDDLRVVNKQLAMELTVLQPLFTGDLAEQFNFLMAIVNPELPYSIVDLRQTLEGVIYQYKEAYSFKINFINYLKTDNNLFLGSKYQLKRIIGNLLNNSRAAFINNHIDRNQCFVEISLALKKDSYVITYKDNAGGIPADLLGKIFEPRFTTKNREENPLSGFGMIITKEFVGKMGGTISVQSELGKGMTFTITLPAASSSPAAADSAKTGALPLAELSPEQSRLIDNKMMDNLLARRTRAKEKDMENLGKFLAMDHPEVKKIFAQINSLSDKEILDRADALLGEDVFAISFKADALEPGLKSHLTFRELFIRPGTGGHDLTQVFLTGFHFPKEIIFFFEDEPDFIRRIIEAKYLLMKALEVLSRKSDLVLINKSDIDELYAYLLVEFPSSETALRLLSLADLLAPYDTLQEQESLKNLLVLIEHLQKGSKEWSVFFSSEAIKEKVEAARQNLIAAKNGSAIADSDKPAASPLTSKEIPASSVIEAKKLLALVTRVEPVMQDESPEPATGTQIERAYKAFDKEGIKLPFLIKVPLKSEEEDLKISLQFAKENMGGIMAPFTVLEGRDAVLLGEEYPFLVLQRDLVVFEKYREFPATYTLPSGEKVNLQEKRKQLLMEIIKKGIHYPDLEFGNVEYGLDAITEQLFLFYFSYPEFNDGISYDYFEAIGYAIGMSYNERQYLESLWGTERNKCYPVPDVSYEQERGSSPLGGIDMRHLAKNTIIEKDSSSNLLKGQSPSGTDPKELEEIQRLIQAGIIPATKRLEECRGACSADALLSCIADILRIEEERVTPTEAGLKNLLALIETSRYPR